MTSSEPVRPKKSAKLQQKRRPKKLSEAYLERAALFHLQRFAASRAHLREILRRRVKKRVLPEDKTDVDAETWIADVLDKLERLGLLDDAVYAANRARSQFLRGRPERVIARDLRSKGVPEALIAPALAQMREEEGLDSTEDSDLAAAQAYARRRRLGPWRITHRIADPQEQYRKDLGALARAGFSYDIARKVLETAED